MPRPSRLCAKQRGPVRLKRRQSIQRAAHSDVEKKRQTACKPGSVHPFPKKRMRRPFLWDVHRCTPHATNPGSGAGMLLRRPMKSHDLAVLSTRASLAAPIRSCSRWGLPCHPRCRGRGALLPHRFTHALRIMPKHGGRAVCFLWHYPWGRPRRPLAGTVFPWSPDFPPTPLPESGRVSGRPTVWQGVGRAADRFCQPCDVARSAISYAWATVARRARVAASALPSGRSGRKRR